MSKKPYMQMSKKLSIAVLSFYAAYIITVTTLMFVFGADDNTTSTTQTVVGYLSGFSAVVLTAYFGNSGIEKYSRAKYNVENFTEPDSFYEDESSYEDG